VVKINTKKVAFEKRGDKIEVKLLDSTWQVYYKREVGLLELPDLLKDLENYGIELAMKKKVRDKSWFG